ncbi:MAG: hypothetical protein SFW09_22125, partial [Hyphomicrobiaceae bacterium]|nr:hypothetical protein [Hyphomicrobiaceae bacterium]
MQDKAGTDGDGQRGPAALASTSARPLEESQPASAVGIGGVLALFTATTFLSALLLFSVQPMFAKMVLPILGGSPSVWAVAMLFFQAALLAGYCYAHLLISTLRPWIGGLIHIAVCAAAAAALPIGVPQSLGEPPPGDPVAWQLMLFAVGVGMPFFAVSANAPLLQAWFAASGHPHGNDPYFLYGASNLGSLLALLAYPLVLEPAFGVGALARFWAAGFIALIALIVLSLFAVRRADTARAGNFRSVSAAAPAATASVQEAAPPGWARRLGWVGLAFVPSALLTAFTNHITMDVASAPLLWVLPLALYLLTFVLVFRDRPIALVPSLVLVMLVGGACWSFFSERLLGAESSRFGMIAEGMFLALVFLVAQRWVLKASSMDGLRAVHIATLVLALLALAQTEHEGWFITASTGVAVFFASTMVAHRTLYETRPSASRLTEFYLLMSLGGVLGGVFAALIAPRVFSQIYEYPILLALTVACRPGALSLRFGRAQMDSLLVLWLIVAA